MESWTTRTQLPLEFTVLPTTRRRQPKKKNFLPQNQTESTFHQQWTFPFVYLRDDGIVTCDASMCLALRWNSRVCVNRRIVVNQFARFDFASRAPNSWQFLSDTSNEAFDPEAPPTPSSAVKSFSQTSCHIEISLFIWFEVIVPNHHAKNLNFNFSQINCARNAQVVDQSSLVVAPGPSKLY